MKIRLKRLSRQSIQQVVGLSFQQLTGIAGRAATYYHPTTLHDGRELSVPSGKLKTVQTRLQRRIFRHHEYHPAVYSARGRGVLRAAARHVKRPYILHLDVESFFPSVTLTDVRSAFSREGVPADLVPTLTRLVTHDGQLPQGCPTSTSIGDLVLRRVDERVAGFCRSKGLTYTRYVDDIVVSGGGMLPQVEGTIRQYIEDCGWNLNEKGGLIGADDQHLVLGVVVNTRPNIRADYYQALRQVVRGAHARGQTLRPKLIRTLRGRVRWVAEFSASRAEALKVLVDAIEGRSLVSAEKSTHRDMEDAWDPG